MALTSVDPDKVSQSGANTSAPDNSLMKQPPQTPIPSANPMNTSELNSNMLARATAQGDSAIASAKSSSSGGGGSPLGGIFGAVGSILGGLFAQGGLVGDEANGYAKGGKVTDPTPSVDPSSLPTDLPAAPTAPRNTDPTPAPTLAPTTSNAKDPAAIQNLLDQQQNKQVAQNNPSGLPDTLESLAAKTAAKATYAQDHQPPVATPNPTPAPNPSPTPAPPQGPVDYDYTGMGPGWNAPTFAKGGEVGQNNPLHHALAAGYLTGALHQSKFGGTPETLQQAADIIKQMLSGGGKSEAPGMAAGGQITDDSLAQQSLMEALGLSSSGQQQQQPQMGQPAEVPTQPQQPMADGGPATNRSAMSNAMSITGEQMRDNKQSGVQPMLNQLNSNIDTTQQLRKELELKGLKGFAIGGPGIGPQAMPQGDPTGQPQGDDSDGFEGEVKGPGGPTDDAIPARLSNGEFVMSAASTAFFGVDKLNKMNEQGKQGFMQAKAQVDQNQNPQGQPQGAPQGAPPQAAPQGMPPMGMMQPPPMQQAKGGPAVMKTKGCGYMGL